MNSQTQTQEMIINSLDAELIFDTKHLLMNYLKFNSFNEKCFTDTTIQVSPEIKNLPPQSTQSSTAFASKYFTLLASQENAIDIISPIISNSCVSGLNPITVFSSIFKSLARLTVNS